MWTRRRRSTALNAEAFRKILLHAADCEHATVVVNMAGTQFCDSAVWA